MSPRRWFPLGTQRRHGLPETGWLLALDHGAWRVADVKSVPVVADADVEEWRAAGSPDPETWEHRPFLIRAVHVAGHDPHRLALRPDRTGVLRVAARWKSHMWLDWDVYPRDRWPMCSCCGEPAPCRAELEDRTVEAEVSRADEHAKAVPGSCWACHEPITRRQGSVIYDGVNLDLPLAAPPRFHTRRSCAGKAEAYERRWLAEDVARPRILTWPRCSGVLTTHADGSSECHGGDPDCSGHLTHDHGSLRACQDGDECPVGCGPRNYIRTSPRPARTHQRALDMGGAA